jgi:glycosyltransferase involved in cell wall biosynthesis
MMNAHVLRQSWDIAKQVPMLRRITRLPIVEKVARRVYRRITGPAIDYEPWMQSRIEFRRKAYQARREPGLLSFLTTVWNTPVQFLKPLAESLFCQADEYDFEWVLLDNGSAQQETVDYVAELAAKHKQIRYSRVEKNLGIIGGMRFCLERATGRYVLPLDSDDWLYPDCLQTMIWHIQKHNYPALLYTDEDKLVGDTRHGPFFKSHWDPVLFANSCYIAHLCAFDRVRALELDVYGDRGAEGCHDWDTYFRFWLAGHNPLHVPEVLYSWRMHENSCAQNMESKSYIHQSHRAVLDRYLAVSKHTNEFELLLSPFLKGLPEWWLRRKHVNPRPLLSVVMSDQGATDGQTVICSSDYPDHRVAVLKYDTKAAGLKALVAQAAQQDGLVCLVSERVRIENSEWPWEALGLMERYSDTVLVGGVIRNGFRTSTAAGLCFGFGDGLGCPDRDRPEWDCGYGASMWKQRSVSAVDSQFCVFDAVFLHELLNDGCPQDASLEILGAWAGAYAMKTGKRVVFSPFLQGSSDEDWQVRTSTAEQQRFLQSHVDLLPDRRYYPVSVSLASGKAFHAVPEGERRNQEQQLAKRLERAA